MSNNKSTCMGRLFLILAIVFILSISIIFVNNKFFKLQSAQTQHGIDLTANNAHINLPCFYMCFSDSSIEIETDGNTWDQITNLAGDAFTIKQEVSIAYLSGDTVQINTDGCFSITCNISFRGHAQPTNWDFGICKNDTMLTYKPDRGTNAVGQTGNLTIIDAERLYLNDKLTIKVKNKSNSDNCIIESVAFYMLRLSS